MGPHIAEAVPSGATPSAVVFECADSVMPSTVVFDQPADSLIAVRTWGHLVDRGVLGTIEYAVSIVEVPLVVVLGHEQCAAIRLLGTDTAQSCDGHLRTCVEQVGFSLAVAEAGQSPAVTHVLAVAQRLVERSALLADRVRRGRCAIVAAITGPDGGVRLVGSIGDLGA